MSYALATLGWSVRHVLGDQLDETPREQLIADLTATFRGADELTSAVRHAYTRSLQSLVVGLKQAWLLMETGGEHDYCEAFGEVRAAFVEEEGIEGPLLLTFLDGFFLDYDTALDAEEAIFGLEQVSDEAFFATLLDAGNLEAAEGTAQCTGQIRAGLISDEVALEEEHPIVRLGCWRDLLAEGLHFHLTELCRHHPSWSRYLESFKAGTLEREEGRAIAKQDERVQRRLAIVRQLIDRREAYKEGFGEILPNLEWLFDIADRLEDVEE
ncbi:MAG TPA: hypothetical protein DEA08_35555, partial [Planctomycetes bacterium]|nr:hypothetical protein [Planctomycetota bacterium]